MEQLNPPLTSWKVHPARERWKIALATAAVIVCAAWLVAELMELPAWGVFGGIALVVGCNRFFFPTSYELTEESITARYPLKTVRYQWPELRRFVYDQTGGFLSPRAKRSMLDEYRGISLLFGEGKESQPSPLTLTLSPEGRGDKSVSGKALAAGVYPLTHSFEGRGDKAGRIVQEILKRLPKEAVVREIAPKRQRIAEVSPPCQKEMTSCGG